MNRPFNKIWKETLLIAICFLLLGCFLLMKPEITKDFFAYIVGAFVLMLGILALFKHYQSKRMFTFDLAYSIVCIIGAFILFLNRDIIFELFPWVIGAIMIANSIFKIRFIFDLKKANAQRWYLSLILTIVKLLIGILLIVNPFADLLDISYIIGIMVIIFAICDVADLIIIKVCLNEQLDNETSPVNQKDVIENIEIKEINEDLDA